MNLYPKLSPIPGSQFVEATTPARPANHLRSGGGRMRSGWIKRPDRAGAGNCEGCDPGVFRAPAARRFQPLNGPAKRTGNEDD